MKHSVQFSITRIDKGTIHIVTQDLREIIRSYDVTNTEAMTAILNELHALRPVKEQ